MKTINMDQLYSNYKRVSDSEIKKYLKDIKIVRETNKGVGTLQGYYPLTKTQMSKISKTPRNLSLTFDVTKTKKIPITNLKKWKDIIYLVKSTSRFFLKPDIGEIFDQIDPKDLESNKIKAICFKSGSELIDNTEGEHFLMTATLLIEK